MSTKKLISHDSKIEVARLLLIVQGSGCGFVWVLDELLVATQMSYQVW